MGKTIQIARKMACLPIIAYQYALTPLMAPCCRYYPSCSRYAMRAIEEYGVVAGILMGTRRILRCHPWADGGYDPVNKPMRLAMIENFY